MEDGVKFSPSKVMQNQMLIQELTHKIARIPWRRVTTLSSGRNKEAFLSAPLDSYGSKIIIDEISFIGGLHGVAFQHFMKCKEKGLISKDGRPHWRNAKM